MSDRMTLTNPIDVSIVKYSSVTFTSRPEIANSPFFRFRSTSWAIIAVVHEIVMTKAAVLMVLKFFVRVIPVFLNTSSSLVFSSKSVQGEFILAKHVWNKENCLGTCRIRAVLLHSVTIEAIE